MSSTRPNKYGGTITVSDSQSLANLNVDGLPPGTMVWNEDVGAFFKLTTCARRVIELDAGDGYDTGVWTFANGAFTADDVGDTLVVRLNYPNAGYNENYFIDSVDSATEITVLPAPADTTTAPIAGAVTVVATGPSEADVTVAVQAGNVFGVVWRVQGPGVTVEQAEKIANVDDWLPNALATMKLAVPSITGARELAPILLADATPGVNFVPSYGTLMGSTVTGTNTKAAAFSDLALTATPLTTSWAFAIKGTLQTSTAGNFNFLGLLNAAASHDYGVATYSTADDLLYLLYTYDGSEVVTESTVACDDLEHTFVVGLDVDAGLLSLYIDGELAASTETLTGISDEAVFLGLLNGVEGDAVGQRAAFGYVS